MQAASSVFPTRGSANPKLTIVALAIRLADYVKKSYGIRGSGNAIYFLTTSLEIASEIRQNTRFFPKLMF